MSALDAWRLALRDPLPGMGAALWLRDRISGLFGVAPISGLSDRTWQNVTPGDKLDFFLVEEISPRLLVLTARDRHLDVMTTIATFDGTLTITSSVITHNNFGRVYMLAVGPAHKVIVWSILRKIRKALRGT